MTSPTRRSLTSELVAGAILGLFAGLVMVVVFSGLVHILAGVDRGLVGAFLTGTSGAGVVLAVISRRRTHRATYRADDWETVTPSVSIGGTGPDDVPWSDSDPFGRDWTGGKP